MALLRIDEYGVFIWPWRIIHRKHEALFDKHGLHGYVKRTIGPFVLYRKAR